MIKQLIALLAVGVVAVVLSACGDSSTPATQSSGGGAPAGPLKVGLLVTGSTSDHGWNELAADSLAAVAKDQKIEFLALQNVPKDKAADAIRQCENKGYGLVIAHGYEYLDVAKELTDPSKSTATKVKIAVSGGDVDSPNFQSLLYDLGPASYQLGIIAAKVSASGKIGFIGGQPFPTVTAMQHGFEAGAKSVKPDITVISVYTDNWDSPAIAKTKAEGLIAQGVDVLMQNVDAAGNGVFEAVKEANAKEKSDYHSPVYAFGANSDQNLNAICPGYTLASAVIKMDACFAKVIQDAQSGSFKGGLVHEDIANGRALAVLNPALLGKVITPETQKLVEDAGKKLAAGEIKIPNQ